MRLEYLEEFIVIANRRSYARAAKELHISQPVLSKHVQSLERELCSQLLNRDSHAVSLTPAGRIVLSAAESMMSIWELAAEEISKTRNVDLITVGGNTRSDCVRRLVSTATSATSVNVRLANVTEMPICDALEAGIVDLAFASLDDSILRSIGQQKLQSVIVRKERLHAVMNFRHELADCKELSLAQISSWPLVRISQDYGSDNAWGAIEALCDANGFHPRSKLYFTDSETLHLADELFLLPEGEVAKELERMGPETIAVPFSDDEATMDLHLVYRKESISPSVDRFIEALINAVRDLGA